VRRADYIFVISCTMFSLPRTSIAMGEDRPEAEQDMSARERKDVAFAVRHVGRILREQTDAMLGEQLPELMERLLDKLGEIER
jgi:hypothetical protein